MKKIFESNGIELFQTNNPDFYLIRSTGIDPPLVGSGKILRRTKLSPPPNGNNRKRVKRRVQSSGKKKRQYKISPRRRAKHKYKTNPPKERRDSLTGEVKIPKYGTASVKMCFLHWNGLGHPMQKHQSNRESKIFRRSVLLLQKYHRKYSAHSIMNAMSLARDILTADWFCGHKYFRKNKLGLPKFIQADSTSRSYLPGKFAKKKSILQEFMKGEEYIRKNYSLHLEDKYPHVTNAIANVWVSYTNEPATTANDINNFIRCAEKIVKFCKLNPDMVTELGIVEVIDQAMNYWESSNKFKPKHTGYLTNNIFWEQQLPKALTHWDPSLKIHELKLV